MPKKVICLQCDKSFETYRKNIKYCSRRCFNLSRQEKTYEEIYGKNKANSIKEKIRKKLRRGFISKCKMCGKPIYIQPSLKHRKKFCSYHCMGESLRKSKQKNVCQQCGKVFFTIPSKKRRFCSRKCSGSLHKGREPPNKGITIKIPIKCSFCGKTTYQYPKRVEKYEKFFCNRKCWDSYMEKYGSPRKGMKASEEIRRRISEAQKGRESPFKGTTLSEVTKKKISVSVKKAMRTPEVQRKIRKPKSKEHIEKMRKISKKRWEDLDWKKHQLKKMMPQIVRPTKPEKKLIDIINQNNLPFKYNGDKGIIIGNRCPDFLSNNGEKQVIEIFGKYWHSPLFNLKLKPHYRYQTTIDDYKKHGYVCLIIWSWELKNSNNVLVKIQNFIK